MRPICGNSSPPQLLPPIPRRNGAQRAEGRPRPCDVRRRHLARLLAEWRRRRRLLHVQDGPYSDPNFFGDGVGIAVKKNNIALRRALDYALARVSQKGVYSELYLKYFPVGPY